MQNKRDGVLEFDVFSRVARFSSAQASFDIAFDGADAIEAAPAVASELISRGAYPATVLLPSSMLGVSVDTIPALSYRRSMKLLSNQLSGRYADIRDYVTFSLPLTESGKRASYATYLVKRTTVESIKNTFRVKGMGAPVVTCSPLALASVFLRSHPIAESSSFLLVDIRQASTFFVMRTARGGVLFDEISVYGDGELIVRRTHAFMLDAKRSLGLSEPISLIAVSGTDGELCEKVADGLGAEPVRLLQSGLTIDKKFRF